MKNRLVVITTAGLAILTVSAIQSVRADELQLAQATTTNSGATTLSTSPDSSSMPVPAAKSDLAASDKKFLEKAAAGSEMEVVLGRVAAERATSAQVKQFGQRMVDDHSKAFLEVRDLAARKGVMLGEKGAASTETPADRNKAATDTMVDRTGTGGGNTTGEAHTTTQDGSTAGGTLKPATGSAGTTGIDTASSTRANPSMKDGAPMPKAPSMTGLTAGGLDADGRRMVEKVSSVPADRFDREYMEMMVTDHEKDVKEFEDASKNAKDSDVRALAAKTLPTLREHLRLAQEAQKVVKNEAGK